MPSEQGTDLVALGMAAFMPSFSTPCVYPEMRRQGIATKLVRRPRGLERGTEWLHVDFEPHPTSFYHTCGFRRTEVGLIQLG
ncbi:hypothetical protein Rleg2_2201 [Rhizobium leguminosarum bv. trifolii WSM2304]|uniref:N-acetyltransferase domain-containing protein n=1 Tax=Rhizobium leguminosarum bv. trifolii (strain WSM2304) TaxID=395492 RepID=A0ABF7QMX6_RHILW|nr:hypothetical protein Rleg2_2201 [Rhizobium leguminosarum bv. trifolii WSM2304]